jgi:hypothetical protein
MFYASRGAPPIFYELKAKAGERIALSEWIVIDPIWMHNFGYHQDALRRLGGLEVPPRSEFENPIPNETKANSQMRRRLSLAFTEDITEDREYRYKQSVAINELHFDKAESLPRVPGGPRTDYVGGTAYPAMRMRGVADNLAIWPKFVDTCLKLRSVRYVLVEMANEQQSSYTLLNLAIAQNFSNGEIEWQDTTGPEQTRRSHVHYENGSWLLRDGYNRIYDVH